MTGAAQGAVVTVVSSGGFAGAFRVLAPQFERATGNTVVAKWGPSMGNTSDAVPARIQRGESIDVVIMVGAAFCRASVRRRSPPTRRAARLHDPLVQLRSLHLLPGGHLEVAGPIGGSEWRRAVEVS